MSFKDLVDCLKIQLDVDAQSKADAIETLVTLMTQIANIDHSTIVKKLIEREAIRGTAINGIGHPHSLTEDAPFLMGAIIVLRNPIEWDTNKKVNIAVSVIAPARCRKEYMQSIGLFSWFFERMKPQFVASRTPEDAHRLIKEDTFDWSKHR